PAFAPRGGTHVGRGGAVTVWVDADACPGVIREILFRAARRTGVQLTLVANRPAAVPRLPNIASVQVASGFDAADDESARRAAKGDLVITADIPLASAVIAKGAEALSPRGKAYTAANIGAQLNMRDFMDTMRASGVHGGGPPPFSATDRQAFANKLDAWLARR